jgi:hypothetical protein
MPSRYFLSKFERSLLRSKLVFDQKKQEEIEEQELFEMYSPFQPQTTILFLNQDIISSKKIKLPKEPSTPRNVQLVPVGGIHQVYGKDFIINGAELIWKELGLDNFLEANDILIVQF